MNCQSELNEAIQAIVPMANNLKYEGGKDVKLFEIKVRDDTVVIVMMPYNENNPFITVALKDVPCILPAMPEIFTQYMVAQLLKIAQARTAADCRQLMLRSKNNIASKLRVLQAVHDKLFKGG